MFGMLQRFPDAAKRASLWGAFFIAGVLPLGVAPVRAADCTPPGPLREVRVARVVDGDTLRLADGRSVRLIGVNAPELAHDGRAAEPLAEAATQHLQRLVAASGGQVGLLPGVQEYDRYGRSLAHAFGRDGRNWEAQQLAEGLGFAVAIAPNTALSGCLFAAERTARVAGKGVWRQSPLLEAGQVQRGGFAVVRGRIEAVERNRGGVWLELAGPLVLRVAPQWLGQFDERALLELEGREVEARGWVVERGRSGVPTAEQARWLLNLSDPAMLERH